MPTVEQRLKFLEDRVAVLTDAYERNMEFIGKKLSEHSQRFDRLEVKMDVMAADIVSIKAGIDALPSIIARTFDEVLKMREKQRVN